MNIPSTLSMPSETAQQVIVEAARRMHVGVRFQVYPAARALLMVNAGDIDGDALRSTDLDLNEYANIIRVEVPIASDDLVAYGIGQVVSPQGWPSLKKYRLGSVRIAEFEKLGPGYQMTFLTEDAHVFEMLKLGRIDLAILPRGAGCLPAQMGYPEITVQEPPLQKILFTFYLNRRHLVLARQFESTLRHMQEEGELARIQQGVRNKWSRCVR